MSLRLLENYNSDSSDTEHDSNKQLIENTSCETKQQRTLSFFDADYSSSDSSTSEEFESNEPVLEDVTVASNSLPLPELADVHHGIKTNNSATVGSVFSNPYKEEEDVRLRLLEHHVPLTSLEETKSMKSSKGQKMCYNKGSTDKLRKRRAKSGLSHDLVPPKKYMKIHREFQAKERPWTIKK